MAPWRSTRSAGGLEKAKDGIKAAENVAPRTTKSRDLVLFTGGIYHPRIVALRTLFLDAGGVLVVPNWQRVSDAMARHGVEAPASALAEAEHPAKRELDTPDRIRTTTDDKRGWVYFHLVLAHAGITRSEATDAALAELRAYHEEHNLWETIPPDVSPALTRFRRLGLRLVVVSNANGTVRAKLDRLGLASSFETILDSQEEGVEKPDPRLFERALVRSGATREETLHAGDLYEVDVVGARAAGIAPVLVDRGGLYPDADCPRVATLMNLADRLESGPWP
jgi:HAD superfamily hydrolase (TIGR01549 family)